MPSVTWFEWKCRQNHFLTIHFMKDGLSTKASSGESGLANWVRVTRIPKQPVRKGRHQPYRCSDGWPYVRPARVIWKAGRMSWIHWVFLIGEMM